MKKMKKVEVSKRFAKFQMTAKAIQRQQANKIKGGNLRKNSREVADVE